MEPPKSCLFSLNNLETNDEIDSEFLLDKDFLLQTLTGLSEREALDKLNVLTSSNPDSHKRVCVALLYVMLTDQSQASKAWRDLTIVSRDNLLLVLARLNQLVSLRFEKLLMPVKMQLIWILEQIITSNIPGGDQLFVLMMSCIKGGDTRSPNVLFAEQMIKIVTSQLNWVVANSFILNLSVFTFLRLIIDHTTPQVAHLRKAEISLSIKLIRENFTECMKLGRDLIRLLQGVAKIPEFIDLWRDILYSPQKLSPSFTGILQILSVRTSRRFLASRLTPDMEARLSFLATQVKFGQHQRYQTWFARRYFTGPETQTLVCDCIRYICGVIHPTNEMLNSNIVPRWALIGWLLTTITSNVMAAQTKLALFYDWFFYNKESDSIMNIEPGILVMNHALKSHPVIAATLMDFIIRMTDEFCPELQREVWSGINNSFKDIIDKKVIADFALLVSHPKLDEELRLSFHRKFPGMCLTGRGEDVGVKEDDDSKFSDDDTRSPPPPPPPPPAVNLSLDNREKMLNESAFSGSQEEEEEYVPEFVKEPVENGTVDDRGGGSVGGGDSASEYSEDNDSGLSSLIDDLDPSIKEEIRKFAYEAENIAQRTSFGNVISRIMDHPAWTRAKLATVAKCLHVTLQPYFSLSVMDDEDEQVPLHHGIFQLLSILTKDKRPRIWKFLSEFYNVEPRVGYHLLYYLYSRAQLDLYLEFTSYTSAGTLKACLTEDLRICQEEDSPATFYKIIPDLYQKFPAVTTGNSSILHLIVSCIDSQQLHTIVCNVMSKKMKIFNVRSISSLLRATLEWETFEQYCVWQLLSAESVPSESVIDVLKDIKDTHHFELFSSMLIFLKSVKPTEKVVKKIIFLQNFEDQLVIPITVWWIDKYGEGVIRIIEGFIGSAVSSMDDKRLNILVQFVETICKAVDTNHVIYNQANLWRQIKSSYSFISASVKENCLMVQKMMKEGRKQSGSQRDSESGSDQDSDESEEERPKLSKRKRDVSVLDSDDD